MRKHIFKLSVAICFYTLVALHHGFSQVKLPRLISDGMVLQRDADTRIWGWAAAGERISINFINKNYAAFADKTGNWEVVLSGLKAGGPFNMQINASNQIIIKNIFIGDVWVCSGQSNMELSMKRVETLYSDVIATANNPFIRYFQVPYRYNFNTPELDLASGNWKDANPETVLSFGAVAYFFARELYEKHKIPIGLINSSLGGSPIEAWLSEDALKEFPIPFEEAKRFKDSTLIADIESRDKAIGKAWFNKAKQLDDGYKEKPWHDPNTNTLTWKTMNVPGYWADGPLGLVNGVVWFRKEVNVPTSMVGKPADLLLGRIVDSDSVYVNGIFVGSTGYQYPPRKYQVPANLLKEGKNIIVVRVINNAGRGGFVEEKPYQLAVGDQVIDLKGEWQYKPGAIMDPLPGQTFIRWKPLGLYNGMISPLIRYRIKGVIWYQGESNTGDPETYDRTFPALIMDWRKKWNQGNFPFLYVQLTNFMEEKETPVESNWARLREAQLKALAIPNTGMAVTIDIGEWNDIHPLNKRDVGRRLALAAHKVAYGNTKVVHSGPIFKSLKINGKQIIIDFINTGGGLISKENQELKGFAIAGPDKKFVWAKAKIQGNKVIVWSDHIANPTAVRYAWADNPQKANLYNIEGLPASPFRTDQELIHTH